MCADSLGLNRVHDDKQSQDRGRLTPEIEESVMDVYRATNAYGHTSRQNHVLNTVADHGYIAPAMLAHAETHQRMLAEARLRQFGNETAPARRPQLIKMVRQRLGSVLILVGTTLQGVHAVATTVPAASDAGSATA
jgi:hypothetical protein